MKNTKNYKSVCLMVMVIFFTSCSEDLLDVSNENALAVNDFWKTERDAQMGLNSIYHCFHNVGGYARWLFFNYDCRSDEGYSDCAWVEMSDWTRFKPYPGYNFEIGFNVWRVHYKGIFRANQVLHYVPEMDIDDELKDAILGQAYCLRGIFYYNLNLLWGGVPVVEGLPDVFNKPYRQTEDSTWNYAIENFRMASELLPEVYTNIDDVGRVTKGAALAFMGKCYLQKRDFQSAKDAFYWLVEGDGKDYYGLVETYEDNFRENNENNFEAVFEVQFSDEYQTADGDHIGSSMALQYPPFLAPDIQGAWNNCPARSWLVDEFKEEKDLDGNWDHRLDISLLYKNKHLDFGGEETRVYDQKWRWGNQCFFRKYLRDYKQKFETVWSAANLRVIRYADVLLMYAEAINEINGGPNSMAYECVDRVRARANMAALTDIKPGMDKNGFFEQIKHERVVELCGESTRWSDLMRWGYFDDIDKIEEMITRDPDFNNYVFGRHKYLPIPQLELDANENLVQNPDY
jgi:starch-binding outer membrane protein, SusD/RagB family